MATTSSARPKLQGCVIVIDDDPEILAALATLLAMEDHVCMTFPSALAFLEAVERKSFLPAHPCCVLCDVKMPELDGLELQRHLARFQTIPVLLMSGASGAHEVVDAFRAGAVDFLIKPFTAETLLQAVARALQYSDALHHQHKRQDQLAVRIATMTKREREVARHVAKGLSNQAIADELGIALRTVKLHRQRAMEKLGIVGTADLVRIVDETGLLP
jgi:FixJ family two-component response regulator